MSSLVTIIIPVFNRYSLIQETLDSIYNQTYDSWEIIVIDDRSNDGTSDLLKEQEHIESRLKLIIKDNSIERGAPSSRNLGVKYARGKYIIFLDSDDLLHEDCLLKRLEFMNANNTIDFAVFPQLIFFKQPGDSNVLVNIHDNCQSNLDRFLTLGQNLDVPWVTSCSIWRKESLLKYNLKWDENLLGYQDVLLNIEAISKNMNYKVLDTNPDCFWRIHDNRIGSSIINPDINIINSNKYLFFKIWEILNTFSLVTKKRKRRLLKSILFICIDYYTKNKKYNEARIIIIQMYKLKIINKILYFNLSFKIFMNERLEVCNLVQRLFEKTYKYINKRLYIPEGNKRFMKYKFESKY